MRFFAWFWTTLLLPSICFAAVSDEFDIGSGGAPTLTGALGGSVVANPDLAGDLQVTVNFGEISPLNKNRNIRVVIPVAIRSTVAYQLTITPSITTGASPLALQLSDIGAGVQNLRPLANGRACRTPHTIQPPFNNDPSLVVNVTSRASYPSSLGTATNSAVILSGPALSNGRRINPRQNDNGWLFDLVLNIVPQFFIPGSTSVTVTLTLNRGPTVAC